MIAVGRLYITFASVQQEAPQEDQDMQCNLQLPASISEAHQKKKIALK